MLIIGILTNSESWPNINEKNIKVLEDADVNLFKKIFKCSSNRVLFYIETAKLPIRYIISKKRMIYLWHILSRDKNELIRKIYETQKCCPTKGEFLIISEEKRKYGINLSDEEISKLSKYKFKQIVTKLVTKFAYSSLLEQAEKQSKCSSIIQNLHTQDYLKTDRLSKAEQQLLYSLRSRSYFVKSNYKSQFGQNMTCRSCLHPSSFENVDHLLVCEKFKDETDGIQLHFEDVYGPLEKQIQFIKIFKKLDSKRTLLFELN